MDRMHDDEQRTSQIRVRTLEKTLAETVRERDMALTRVADNTRDIRLLMAFGLLYFIVAALAIHKLYETQGELYEARRRSATEAGYCREVTARLRIEANTQRIMRESADDALSSCLDRQPLFPWPTSCANQGMR